MGRCRRFLANQIIHDLLLSRILNELGCLCGMCLELTWRNLEVSEFDFSRKSIRESPWLDSFGIFHNNSHNSCSLELRRVWYLATEYSILLRKYSHAFYSFYYDLGRSLLKTKKWLKMGEKYLRYWNETLVVCIQTSNW